MSVAFTNTLTTIQNTHGATPPTEAEAAGEDDALDQFVPLCRCNPADMPCDCGTEA